MRRYSKDPYWLTARYGNCRKCSKAVRGLRALYFPLTRDVFCEEHGKPEWASFLAAAQDEDFLNRGNYGGDYGY